MKDQSLIPDIETIMEKFCRRYTLDGFRNSTGEEEPYHDRDYVILFKDDQDHESMIRSIEQAGGLVRRFNNQNSAAAEV